MSVTENLVKHLSTILRSSKATLLAILSDKNGLSIAKTGRPTDFELNINAITSVASAAFSSSEENWNDLGILDQIIAFSFFEKLCIITIRIQNTLLTIVHDYNLEWPLNADNIGSSIYHLQKEIDQFFGSGNLSDSEIELFSNNVRSAIYLCGMGQEIPFSSYTDQNSKNIGDIQNISTILDSIQNQIFYRYGLVNSNGMNIDARDLAPDSFEIGVDAFSANANVAFQKMVEEAESMKSGELISYLCVSGTDPENFYGILSSPSGNLNFTDEATGSVIIKPISFVSLFPLTYGAAPVFCEVRNMVYSILEVLGKDEITEKFIDSLKNLLQTKYTE